MRIIIIADQDIEKAHVEKALEKFKEIYAKVGITCEYFVSYEDMRDLPFSKYRGDDIGIDKTYLKKRAEAMYVRYRKAYDNILFWVADHNYEPAKQNIWGWNISNQYAGYQIQQCRFETRDDRYFLPNTIGTLFHEIMHSHDSFVYRNIGKHIEDKLNIPRGKWDAYVVHGKHKDYEYIGRRNGLENQEALAKIAPWLIQALAKRKAEYHGQVRSLAQQVLELMRKVIIQLKKKDHEVLAEK